MRVIEDYLKCIASQAAGTAESCNDHRLMTTFVVQVVQHIELSIEGSGLQYSPGDLLVTLPQQSQSAGEEFLRRMDVATGVCMHGYRRHAACSSPPQLLSKVCRMNVSRKWGTTGGSVAAPPIFAADIYEPTSWIELSRGDEFRS
jgi:hypothetical protein